jgi:hypothetical protein
MFHASVVINHKDPAGFTIETFVVLAVLSGISRGLAREGEVYGQALVWDKSEWNDVRGMPWFA